MSISPSETKTLADPQVPLSNVVLFVRQLSHDLRNYLNAAELQSAFINELAEDAELQSEIKRLRAMLSETSTTLQRLTASLAPIKLTEMTYEAAAFVQDLEEKLKGQFPDQSGTIDWQIKTGTTALQIDPQILQVAFVELFANAFQHGAHEGRISAAAENGHSEFVFTLRQPTASLTSCPAQWGREPFRKLSQGHYGLGLYRARNIIEAHRGHLDVQHDQNSSSLVTTVCLPVAHAG
jgi:K+-sensing histidine kinase KdpD